MIQRCAPLISGPKNSAATMRPSERKNTRSPARRAKRGGKKESVTSTGTAKVR